MVQISKISICKAFERFAPHLVKIEYTNGGVFIRINVAYSSPYAKLVAKLITEDKNTEYDQCKTNNITANLLFGKKEYDFESLNPYACALLFGSYFYPEKSFSEPIWIIEDYVNPTDNLFPEYTTGGLSHNSFSIKREFNTILNRCFYILKSKEVSLFQNHLPITHKIDDYIGELKTIRPFNEGSELITLVRYFEFEACHRLCDYDGKCNNLHGHTYKVEYGVKGRINPMTSMLIDFGLLKKIEKEIDNIYDHKMLNDINESTNFRPTAETLSYQIFKLFKKYLPIYAEIKYVRVWETTNSSAIYEE